jgi:hypothetical protein
MNVRRLFRPGAERFTIRREARRIRHPENPIAPPLAPANGLEPAEVEVMAKVEPLKEHRKVKL